MTPFGVQEIDCPTVYEKPVPDKIILKVDILELLRDRLDDQCFDCRKLLYCIFSGGKGYYDCNEVFLSYYRKFASFRKLVNDAYYYGDETVPLFERVVKPIREELNDHTATMQDILKNAGGKYLIATHDQLYYAFISKELLPEVIGGTVIC